jgi:glycosyltransferase involved in cell wall biosynthesis
MANVVHVESAYAANRVDLYVCHGGFVPEPIPSVLDNLKRAKVIVSVAQWIADQYFPQYAHKTVVIPNGIRLDDWAKVPASGLEPGYVLYAKEWVYGMNDFMVMAHRMPQQRFVTTVWPTEAGPAPSNVQVIGLQSRMAIRSILKDAACLMLPGTEVCPTMLLEAWACKTPVLAKFESGCDTGSAEIMLNNDTPGIVGGVGYYTAEIGTVEYVLEHSQELGEQGRVVVEEKYQWPKLFDQYVRLYEAIEYDEVGSYLASARS